jgi:hypothetical protein
VVRLYPHCQVYAFDPSLNRRTGNDFGPNIHFFNIGAGPVDVGIMEDPNGTWPWRDDPNFLPWSKMRLTTMMEMLNHSHVDVLKIDIEGSEWRTLSSWLSASLAASSPHRPIVKQLVFEAHFGQQMADREEDAFMVDLVGRIRSAGFRIFSRKANWRFSRPRAVYPSLSVEEAGIKTHACHEIGMVWHHP